MKSSTLAKVVDIFTGKPVALEDPETPCGQCEVFTPDCYNCEYFNSDGYKKRNAEKWALLRSKGPINPLNWKHE